jgi:hypothetical protein
VQAPLQHWLALAQKFPLGVQALAEQYELTQ